MTGITEQFPDIAFVGFGEAGHALASSWMRPARGTIKAYDIKLREAALSGLVLERCAQAGVEPQPDPGPALDTAGLVFSLVTADQALDAARSCAPHLLPGALWLDCNSCAPQTKEAAAEVIEAAGGRYVDVAVMAPVYFRRHEVPLLLSGPHAALAAARIETLGLRPKLAGGRVGEASSVKMLRSVMIKGLEALTTECILAARRAGVEDAVLASLQASDPGIDWRARATYNMERMLVHGARRAAEMEEVCLTLTAFGLPDWMSRGTVEWQRRLASLDIDPGADDLARRADAVLSTL